MKRNVGLRLMKRDRSTAVFELRQIAQALSLASHLHYKPEIDLINEQIALVNRGDSPFVYLEMIISHVIMQAKLNGQNLAKRELP